MSRDKKAKLRPAYHLEYSKYLFQIVNQNLQTIDACLGNGFGL